MFGPFIIFSYGPPRAGFSVSAGRPTRLRVRAVRAQVVKIANIIAKACVRCKGKSCLNKKISKKRGKTCRFPPKNIRPDGRFVRSAACPLCHAFGGGFGCVCPRAGDRPGFRVRPAPGRRPFKRPCRRARGAPLFSRPSGARSAAVQAALPARPRRPALFASVRRPVGGCPASVQPPRRMSA